MKSLILIALGVFAHVCALNAQSLRLTVPTALPRGITLGGFSPIVRIHYEMPSAKTGDCLLKVWLLEKATGNYNLASSEWKPRVFRLKASEAHSGELLVVSDMDVFDYEANFLWVARLFDSSGLEVAMAEEESKSLDASPPILNPIGRRSAVVNNPLQFKLGADAPKGAEIRYRMSGASNDATLDPVTGVFAWTPASPGTVTVVFEAVSNEIADAEVVKIEVEKPTPATASH